MKVFGENYVVNSELQQNMFWNASVYSQVLSVVINEIHIGLVMQIGLF